jgi:hypothetical protein
MTTQIETIMEECNKYYNEIYVWPNYIMSKSELKSILEKHLQPTTEEREVEIKRINCFEYTYCPLCDKEDISATNKYCPICWAKIKRID